MSFSSISCKTPLRRAENSLKLSPTKRRAAFYLLFAMKNAFANQMEKTIFSLFSELQAVDDLF